MLGPFEGMGGLIVGGDKSIDVGPQLVGAVEAGAAQRLAAEQAEPDFHMVQPGSVGGGVVKMHLRVPLPPAVAFGLVDVEVVENDRRGATSALEISSI